jgi:hypothetical protein
MSLPLAPAPAKLVIGMILQDRSLVDPIAEKLKERFGAVDMVSSWYGFQYTDYYEKEMGAPLWRRFFAYDALIEQESLPDIKLTTNEIEAEFSLEGRRRMNLDPGYLVMERFVLATGKNFSHRIYLNHGIYADLTLVYTKGAFQNLPWTYPDYQSREVQVFLTKVRDRYQWKLKHGAMPKDPESQGNNQ